MRITRLDELGNPQAGPNNVYVTDKIISIGVTPVLVDGEDIDLVGGCDCVIATYRGFDKLKRFDLEIAQGVLEPALQEMLLGADAISQGGQISGVWWPSNLSCSDEQQPLVAVEAWQDAWVDDRQGNSPFQYIHWIWPAARFQIAEFTLENGFTQPGVMGFTRGNSNWGTGIFGDMPEAAGPLGGWFYTNTRPDAVCDYQTEGLT